MKKNKLLRLLVLMTSITQIISPALSSFTGEENNNQDVQITPAGYTFVIWVAITSLAFVYGVFQMLPNRKNEPLHLRIAPNLIFTYLLFSLWLFVAQKDWLALTVIIFGSMFYNLLKVFEAIIQNKEELSPLEKVILEGQIGLYFGWSSIAIFANTGAALKFYGLSDLGTQGIIWQSILLIGALINTMYWLYKTKANYFYGGTILWAFIGIFFGLRGVSDTAFLQIVTITAVCVFSGAFYRFRNLNVKNL